jgi:uncharacterized protein with HEPN domain
MAKKNRYFLFYIEDMLVNLRHTVEYLHNITFESFCEDTRTQNAVVRCLEITGEAAHSIPEHIKLRYPDLDWDDMYAFRIKAAHHYFDIDLSLVWQIVKQDVPRAILQLERIINLEREDKNGV